MSVEQRARTERILVLLGPQRLRPTLASVLRELGLEGGRPAVVTAGWQHREAEDAELREHVAAPLDNLELYRRADELFSEDPELFEAHRERQDRLRTLQELYRVRLAHALDAARALQARKGSGELLKAERREAIDDVRRLDRSHLERIRVLHREWNESWPLAEREAVARQRDELREILSGAVALVVAGGHVAVLLNRLRLFGLPELAGDLPVVAWSAGAMVLTDQVVLFHDNPPQGPGNAEVLESGLGVVDGLVALPHARWRLRLEDGVRVSLLARRLAPRKCLVLDDGAVLPASEGARRSGLDVSRVRRLTVRGKVVAGPGQSLAGGAA